MAAWSARRAAWSASQRQRIGQLCDLLGMVTTHATPTRFYTQAREGSRIIVISDLSGFRFFSDVSENEILKLLKNCLFSILFLIYVLLSKYTKIQLYRLNDKIGTIGKKINFYKQFILHDTIKL